jgi:hypothetical protein
MDRRRTERLQKQAEHAATIKSGAVIDYTDDIGQVHRTRTRSQPWQLGHGAWVVAIDGKAGGYDVDRVKVVAEVLGAEDAAAPRVVH